MARYFNVHPVDPQRRAIAQVVELVREGGLIAYPTDSCFALGCQLLLPNEPAPLTQGWEIKERLDHAVDAVIDSGDCGTEPTTVIDFCGPEPEIVRWGAGDSAPFE